MEGPGFGYLQSIFVPTGIYCPDDDSGIFVGRDVVGDSAKPAQTDDEPGTVACNIHYHDGPVHSDIDGYDRSNCSADILSPYA